MPTEEILVTRYGEMLDMINCTAIFEGGAEQTRKPISDLEQIIFEL